MWRYCEDDSAVKLFRGKMGVLYAKKICKKIVSRICHYSNLQECLKSTDPQPQSCKFVTYIHILTYELTYVTARYYICLLYTSPSPRD